MKFMGNLAVIFYKYVVLFLGCFLALYVLNFVSFKDVQWIFYLAYFDTRMRAVFGIITAALLFFNFVFWRALCGERERGKSIAFDNPAGRVSVSLTAMEDLIRRVIFRVPEVKEVRSTISAGKKGLQVNAKLVLNADVNIPEMTSRLQDVVKRKIQDTIGIDEAVMVRVHVTKIIPSERKQRRKEKEESKDEPAEPNIPFQGYRP